MDCPCGGVVVSYTLTRVSGRWQEIWKCSACGRREVGLSGQLNEVEMIEKRRRDELSTR